MICQFVYDFFELGSRFDSFYPNKRATKQLYHYLALFLGLINFAFSIFSFNF